MIIALIVDKHPYDEYTVPMKGYSSRINSLALNTEVQTYKLLFEKLLNSFPEADDETLADTLEGITDLHEMIAAVIRSALVDEALPSRVAHSSRGDAAAPSPT